MVVKAIVKAKAPFFNFLVIYTLTVKLLSVDALFTITNVEECWNLKLPREQSLKLLEVFEVVMP